MDKRGGSTRMVSLFDHFTQALGQTKLFLQKSWTWRQEQPNCTLFFSFVSNSAFRITGIPSHFLSLILKLAPKGINGTCIINCAEQFKLNENTIIDTIYSLEKRGVLIKKNDTATFNEEIIPSQYAKQVEFFELFETPQLTAAQINQSLLTKKVLVLGLGGYGTWLSLLFSQVGIGTLIGIDFDRIELSNLNRQVLYTKEDVGKFKTEVCSKFIKNHFPNTNFYGINTKVQSANDIVSLVKEVDFVVQLASYRKPLDPFKATDHITSTACIENCIPYLCLGGNWIGPLYVPQATPCYFCALETLTTRGKENSPFDRVRIGSFAPFIAQTASIAAWEVISHLLSPSLPKSKSYGNIITLDRFQNGNSSTIPIHYNTNCLCRSK